MIIRSKYINDIFLTYVSFKDEPKK